MDKNQQKKLAIRLAIDQIDGDIVNFLSRRLKLVKKITLFKFGEKITDKRREAEIISKAKYKASINNIDEKFIENIFELILINSRKEQRKIIK